MNPHSKVILDKLLAAYEKSLHAHAFQKDSKRRVMFSMKNYRPYDVQDLDSVTEINGAMEELEKKQYLHIEYDQEHPNHMVRIILDLEHIKELYQEYYGKDEKSKDALKLESLLLDYRNEITTKWITTFLQEELTFLNRTGWTHSYLGKDVVHIQRLLQVLRYIDQGTCGYLREMSNHLFHDSKYFEKELKSAFLSLLHRYAPEYQKAKEEEYELRDSELFRSLGFRLYPETFSWKGAVKITLEQGDQISTAPYLEGYLLNGDMIQHIKAIELGHCSRMLLIENKANYYSYLSQMQKDEVVIFAGGHFSPIRKRLYEHFAKNTQVPVSLWSDIDLGGFYMFARLKQEVFSNLQPMRMDKETFLTNIKYAKEASPTYLEKLKKARNREDFRVFDEVIDCILEAQKTLEQESLILQVQPERPL